MHTEIFLLSNPNFPNMLCIHKTSFSSEPWPRRQHTKDSQVLTLNKEKEKNKQQKTRWTVHDWMACHTLWLRPHGHLRRMKRNRKQNTSSTYPKRHFDLLARHHVTSTYSYVLIPPLNWKTDTPPNPQDLKLPKRITHFVLMHCHSYFTLNNVSAL